MVHDAYCICLCSPTYIPQRIGIGIDYRCLLFYFISIHNNTSPKKRRRRKHNKDEFVTEIEQGKGRTFLPFFSRRGEREQKTVERCTLCVMIVVPRT